MLAQMNRGMVVECYRANETYPKQKKAKEIQKDIVTKTVSVSPPVYDMSSAYTRPVEKFERTTDPTDEYLTRPMSKNKKKVMFNFCKCYDDGTDKNYEPKTWNSITTLYGNADTTEVWMDPEKQISTFQKRDSKRKHPVTDTNGNNIDFPNGRNNRKRKTKSHKKHNNHETHLISKDIVQGSYPTSGNPVPPDVSVISLFRKENKKNHKVLKQQSEVKKKTKPKLVSPGDLTTEKSFKEYCPTGLCAEEANKNKNFLCKCMGRKKEPEIIENECTDATCGLTRNLLRINSVVKMKDKFLGICHKYSQKIVNRKSHNNIDVVNTDQITTKTKTPKKAKKINDIVIKKEHESEQTGDPFFEIQVNPSDMCVLNPIEIKQNIIKYGRREKNDPKCICPSRGRLTYGEVCKSGVCKKAYKNKQVNFNCWCDKKIAECGDATCDGLNIRHKQIRQKNQKPLRYLKPSKPLLEVQFDMDKMCVVNPREIVDKILTNVNVDEICSSGVCREAALTRKIPFTCKCIGKKIHSDITECAEDTCMDSTKRKKSKFSLFCTRICSKSENWTHRNRNRNQRKNKRRSVYEISPSKLIKGRLGTQSDNLHKKDVLQSSNADSNNANSNNPNSNNININNLKVKHNSKLNSNSPKPKAIKRADGPPDDKWSPPPKNIGNIRGVKAIEPIVHCYYVDKIEMKQEIIPKIIPKLNLPQKDVNKPNPKYNFNVSPLNGEVFRIHNSNNSRRAEIYDDMRYRTNDVMCACAHKCECDKDRMEDIKIKLKNTKYKEKQQLNKIRKKRQYKKNVDRNSIKEMKRRTKLDKKQEKLAAKARLKEIKMMRKKAMEEPLEANFCTAFLLGILKLGFKTIILIISVMFALIRHPKRCYWYIRDRIRDPEGTFIKMKHWFSDAIMIKKLEIAETIRGSDTLTIIGDHFLDSQFYQSFADKGKTKEEQAAFEQKSKARKRRIRKREQQAITSCRHMLLTTLRQTPCLWVYHICPDFYPQCLGLLAFMRSFSRLLLFLVAFACWTPCIISFELCRACLCCFMCTG